MRSPSACATPADLAAMTVIEAASYWFLRREAEAMSTEDERAFERWRAASESHAHALEDVQATWSRLDSTIEAHELRSLLAAALAAGPAPLRWPRLAAMAGAFVAGVGGALLVWYISVRAPEPAAVAAVSAPTRYVTAHNQRSTVTLPDGTLVTLNLDSVLDTHFTAAERAVSLIRGQGFFEVAKNPARPFIVSAFDRRIRALGTKFDVRLDGDRMEVVLVEGRVRVDRRASSPVDPFMHRHAAVDLAPGQRLVAADDAAPAVTETDAVRATSWHEGWVVFEDQALGDAIDELNRYADHPIVADEAVRQLHFSGVFRIGEPGRFGAVIQELLPVRAESRTDGATVLALRLASERPTRTD